MRTTLPRFGVSLPLSLDATFFCLLIEARLSDTLLSTGSFTSFAANSSLPVMYTESTSSSPAAAVSSSRFLLAARLASANASRAWSSRALLNLILGNMLMNVLLKKFCAISLKLSVNRSVKGIFEKEEEIF